VLETLCPVPQTQTLAPVDLFRYVARMKIKPTPKTIWKRPAYLPYVHAPLTDALIRAAEKQLGFVLPTELLDLLRVQNGGPTRFSLPDSVGDLIAGIGHSFPSITDFNLSDHQEYVDFSMDGLVPFDGDGHWYRCLDYRNNRKTPAVSYIDVECNSEKRLADSFSDFLQLVELDLENEFVLQNVENIDDAQRRLEGLFGSGFERKMSNLGVAYSTLQTGKKRDECFWISSNIVASGYSGDDPMAFEFEGDALLFPELPANAVIFEAPEDYIDLYRSRLQDVGLKLVDVHDAANGDITKR
jgi:hypothetical protein